MFIIVDQFANDSLLILYIYILVIPTYSNIDLIFTCILLSRSPAAVYDNQSKITYSPYLVSISLP